MFTQLKSRKTIRNNSKSIWYQADKLFTFSCKCYHGFYLLVFVLLLFFYEEYTNRLCDGQLIRSDMVHCFLCYDCSIVTLLNEPIPIVKPCCVVHVEFCIMQLWIPKHSYLDPCYFNDYISLYCFVCDMLLSVNGSGTLLYLMQLWTLTCDIEQIF